ncbi:hypothetical protein [Nocardia takedensis]|uniref:hypothetical protein n=1 Tax=Nocardia takedensis TaxID=259390 RepID=UPI0012F70236|nr:hypothetical protein [Nocardia takedensis]
MTLGTRDVDPLLAGAGVDALGEILAAYLEVIEPKRSQADTPGSLARLSADGELGGGFAQRRRLHRLPLYLWTPPAGPDAVRADPASTFAPRVDVLPDIDDRSVLSRTDYLY